MNIYVFSSNFAETAIMLVTYTVKAIANISLLIGILVIVIIDNTTACAPIIPKIDVSKTFITPFLLYLIIKYINIIIVEGRNKGLSWDRLLFLYIGDSVKVALHRQY